MARSGSIRGGGLPPQPPSPQRTLYLGRAAQYFDALAGDLGSAMTASSLTEARLRNHWATHVRPPDHPWLAHKEQAVALAAQGKWGRVMGALRPEADYIRQHLPDDIDEARRTTPDLVSRYIGKSVWVAMTTRDSFLDWQKFSLVAKQMYPDLPEDWLLPTSAAIALMADTTLRLHPRRVCPGVRMPRGEQQFLQAMTEWLHHLQSSLHEPLPAIAADYFPALVHDWRQLILGALGRVVLVPDALTDDHLRSLFGVILIPSALWMLAGYVQPETRQYWYREIQQQFRAMIANSTPSLLQEGLLIVGAAVAEAQGASLDVRWYAARARGIEQPWASADNALMLEALNSIGTACAAPQDPLQLLQTTSGDFDFLVKMPILKENQYFCRGVILLARLLQLHIYGRLVAEDLDADQQGLLRTSRTEVLAAVDRLWDDMVQSTQSVARNSLSPALVLVAARRIADGAVVLILRQIINDAALNSVAQAIIATELRALFQRRGLDDLVELLDMLSTVEVSEV